MPKKKVTVEIESKLLTRMKKQVDGIRYTSLDQFVEVTMLEKCDEGLAFYPVRRRVRGQKVRPGTKGRKSRKK